MKRIIAAILAMLLIPAAALSGCSQNAKEIEKDKDSRISVICTIFPQYDWVRQITGDKTENIDLTLLLSNRIDLHNYQPSVDDIMRISGCDLFVYVGGESDGWVGDALKQATNKNMVIINLIDTLGAAAKIEEIVDGMEADHHDDDDHDEDHHDEDDHDYEADYDEHVWLSLKNAELFCKAITDALADLDTDNAGAFRENLAVYTKRLSDLDAEYQTTVDAAPVKTLLFGDRFPFRYLVDDYALGYYAAFAGCSAETEASFNTIIFLAGKMDELGLKSVMVTESSDKKIAETIIRESKGTDRQILVLDAMQSVENKDLTNGSTYLSIMMSNLDVLKEALK